MPLDVDGLLVVGGDLKNVMYPNATFCAPPRPLCSGDVDNPCKTSVPFCFD